MTNQPISGVSVQLINADEADVVAEGITTESGVFVLLAPSGGTYWFTARMLGYSPKAVQVRLEGNEELGLDVALRRLATQLDTLIVHGPLTAGQREFESRRHLKWSISYDWTEFKDIGAHTVREVIQFGSLGVGPRECSSPDVYLDGLRSRTFGLDVPFNWVYGIEVYRTYYDIPLKYRDPFGNPKCGAVLIWTHPVGREPSR